MQKILIATGNKGKLREIKEAFDLYGASEFVEVLSLKDFSHNGEEPEETGKDYQENALIKAKYFAEKFNIPTIGEDSGLELKAFPEKFGLKTKREISAKSDKEWLEKFLEMLEKTNNREATFFSSTAFFDPQNKNFAKFLGTTSGEILHKPEADIEKGIPVSAVFRVEGAAKVFSAMDKNEKNKVSHRGKSVKQMAEFLRNLYR